MKRIIALTLALILLFSLSACGGNKGEESASSWSITQTVDEFGDVTENSVDVIKGVFTGTFSNTATPGSDLTVVVTIGKKALFDHYIVGFDLKEYNNANATYFSSDSKLFKMKINDEITTMDLTGTEPNGTLYLSGENYEWEGDFLVNELLKGNDVKCIINIGNSEYNFTLLSDNLVTLCNENNIVPGVTKLTVAEAINMLLEDTGEYTEVAEECIEGNAEKYTLLNSSEIKMHLDGDFLEISLGGCSYVNGYAFPIWEFKSFSNNCEKITSSFIFEVRFDDRAASEAIKSGVFVAAYENYRTRTPIKNNPSKVSVENDVITKFYSEDSFSYQCRKISDNIFMLSILSEGEYVPSSLLLKINGNSIADDVEYIKNNNLSNISF